VASEALKEADIEAWDSVRWAEIGHFGRHRESRGLCLGRKGSGQDCLFPGVWYGTVPVEEAMLRFWLELLCWRLSERSR
jgi:hypothetical protein